MEIKHKAWIRELREEAARAGDFEQARLYGLVLAGDPASKNRCGCGFDFAAASTEAISVHLNEIAADVLAGADHTAD